jgi:DNA-binding MarR family transcriptional regulator
MHRMEQLLKPFALTPTQYNVLRILRGAGPEGLCGSDIGRRLVSQVPDMTRRLDRMAAVGLTATRPST